MTLAESSLPLSSKAKAEEYTDSDYDELSRTIDEFIAKNWVEIDAGVEKDRRRTPPTIRSPSPPPLHDKPVPSKADTPLLHDTPVPSKNTSPLHDTPAPSKPETPPFHNIPLLTDSQVTLRGDDVSPRSSKLLLIPESPSDRLGKRKATDSVDEGMMGAGGARKIRKLETTAEDDAPIVPVRAASI
jgi:hypothetical protein